MHLKTSSPKGFTLLEIVLAMGVIALLSGSIIAISSSTLRLTSTLLEEQEEQIHIDDFEHFLKLSLSKIHKESQLNLSIDEQNQGVQTLTIKNPNTFFPNEDFDARADQSSFITQFNKNGLLDILQFNYAPQEQQITEDTPPTHQLTLFKNLSFAEWEFYNRATKQWVTNWQYSMGKPTQIKLNYQPNNKTTKNTFIIWVVPHK